MVIFALHQPVIRIIRFVGERLFDTFSVGTNIMMSMLTSCVVIVVLWPFVLAYNKTRKKILTKLYLHE